jgi:sulfur carrier protein
MSGERDRNEDRERESDGIAIVVNGERRTCAAGLDLESVLAGLGYEPRLVVVEFNGSILPRSRWAGQPVMESDALEVVTIVGGGS